jgi:hypothetical protein
MIWIPIVLLVAVLVCAVCGLPWLALACFFLLVVAAIRGGVL